MADIPNWCEKDLPPTGVSLAITLTIVGLLAIVAGLCLVKGARRTVVIALVTVLVGGGVFVGVLGVASPASAVSKITCPAGYHPHANPAKMSLDFTADRVFETDSPSVKSSRFTLNVDLNGGVVYNAFTVEVTGSALVASPSQTANAPSIVSGTGWTIAAKDNDPRSGVYTLTYTPTGATSKVPPAEVKFTLRMRDLKVGENWTLAATASGIPSNATTATTDFPFSLYDTTAVCGADFVDSYVALVFEGPVVTSTATMVSGTAPFKYVATGLTGYTMAEDGKVTWVDAKPGDAEFSLTVTDATGATFTVPATVVYAANYIYLPDTC